jgi:transcriptional regulator with XRE-family HTH domain
MKGRGVIGERLKLTRERVGLSQDKLAEMARVHRLTVVKLESGARTSASLGTVKKLAKALGVSLAELTEVGESPAEPLLTDYFRSPWREIDHPSEPEIAWLRTLPGIVWRDIPPTAETVHELLQLRRKTTTPRH